MAVDNLGQVIPNSLIPEGSEVSTPNPLSFNAATEKPRHVIDAERAAACQAAREKDAAEQTGRKAQAPRPTAGQPGYVKE